MSSGDEDSKDQQVCQTSAWLHFSLQTGGTTTHYSHDKGDTERRHLSTHGNAVQQGASMRTNVFARSCWRRSRLRAACRQDVLCCGDTVDPIGLGHFRPETRPAAGLAMSAVVPKAEVKSGHW